MTLTPDHWLTTARLADLCGCHRATVQRWVVEHGLAAKRLPSGRYLIRYGDFLAWGDGQDELAVLEDVRRRAVGR